MNALSDESLLAGLAAGDPEGSTAFVRRFQGRVYGLALTIVGDPRVAEDVAQEAFVRAWRHAELYEPSRGRVVAWLLRITRNVALDALRVRRATPVDPEALLGLAAAREGDPEARAVVSLELHGLRSDLLSLPDEQRRAVLLAAFYGRTAREIGEIEGIPLGTAKTRIRSGMRRLREALEVRDGRERM
ncbi:MAG TPA: RNA polymerase sigma factor [Actinomycetota bacterium]